MKQIKEHCGIFGVFNASNAAKLTYLGLHGLQHRGQEGSGIVTSTFDENKKRWVMPVHKDHGLVLDVFSDPAIFDTHLLGHSAIGHNRYSTSGASDNRANIQPFKVHYRDGNLALAHNGNISNARELWRSFSERGTIFQTSSDSEIVLHLIAQSRRRKQTDQILDALSQLEGAFSLLMLTDDSMIAVRDPNGFRPLALGKMQTPNTDGLTYLVSSETCTFDLMGAEYVRDIEPGEILVISRDERGETTFTSYHLPSKYRVSQCIFEYIYFARPDSMVFGEMVDKVRRKIGKELAHDAPVPKTKEGDKPPIVISVPDSSNTATLGYVSECQKLGYDCKYEIGLIRNHYIGRTFIAPGQDTRETKVRLKFNTVDGVLKDRVVVIVDDSIVRGTTARFLVNMIREAGAKAVHFRVSSPPVISPCFYGMDFPSKEELFANQFGSIDEMAEWLGVDSVAYISTEGMMKAVKAANESKHGYCNACFTKNYPTPVEMGVTKEDNEW